ncbi:MAG TPA: metallophosphoesterase [Pseudomonadales bacterium]|nr:metallophosphoesterase [Pseudomonadales bacterium]
MRTYVIGDLHGYYAEYRRLLVDAGLADAEGQWTGGDSHLWLIGDIYDRGEQATECVDLTMSLQHQAAEAGGHVNALLGNHEMMLLCACKFGDALTTGGMRVADQWQMWGGVPAEMEKIEARHIAWLERLPAMQLLGDTLLIHADAMFYVEHGRTPEQVNASLWNILASADLHLWEGTLRAFTEHRAFSALGLTGQQRAERLLQYFKAERLIHGHTPIPLATGQRPDQVREAWTYANGRCVNVDGGIYLGSPGFVYQLDQDVSGVTRAVSGQRRG